MAEARKIAFGQVEKFNIDSATISIPVNNEIECVDVPALWLRWNCECPKCKQASSGQKTLETKNWSRKPELTNAWTENGKIYFEMNEPDHVGEIDFSSFRQFLQNENQRIAGTKMTFHDHPEQWIPQMNFENIHSQKGQYQLTKQIAVNGYCLINNCPSERDDVLKVANAISTPIPSVYGITFDVKSLQNPNNVAYSNLALAAHVDLTYFESPPGIQYFLCRRNDECVIGGESTLVDAFAAARDLRLKYPKHYETLSKIQVRFQKIHYDRESPVHIEWQSSHLVLGPDGDLKRVNWAPAFEGRSPLSSYTQEYFEAYQAYIECLENSPTNFVSSLKQGDCLVFNQRRMLHGRKGFELNGGVRHLEGTYSNLCEFRSRAQVLENAFGNGDLIQEVGNGNNI